MENPMNSFGTRVLLTAFLVAAFIIGLATYRAYSEDVKQHFSEKVAELLPDLDNSLAQL